MLVPSPSLPAAASQRIAMWSGPRNISTAMMRAWENRGDCHVTDEPFYAHYLHQTGAPHPGAAEVIAAGDTDWTRVVARLTGPVPQDRSIWFQKHMTHHLLPGMDLDWMARVTNCFLIRDPREMLPSLLAVTPGAQLLDTGLPQQWRIFEWVRQMTPGVPPILDARDVLENPRATLGRLCSVLGIAFSERMLRWPPGPRDSDGVWAPHWYANVERSTGFASPRRETRPIPEDRTCLLAECEEIYQALRAQRLVPP